jgi:hypothetical protein
VGLAFEEMAGIRNGEVKDGEIENVRVYLSAYNCASGDEEFATSIRLKRPSVQSGFVHVFQTTAAPAPVDRLRGIVTY